MLKMLKDNLANILTLVTLLGIGSAYLATKGDVNNVNKSVNILRIEINIKINDDKLLLLDSVMDKTPAQIREVNALIEANIRMSADKEKLIHENN